MKAQSVRRGFPRIRARLTTLGIPLFQSTPDVDSREEYDRCVAIFERLVRDRDQEMLRAIAERRVLWAEVLRMERERESVSAGVAKLRRRAISSRPPRTSVPSHLYFICNPRLDAIKIGVATSVERRLDDLERACGMKLVVLGVLPNGAKYERGIHAAFATDRLVGEWFTASPELNKLARSPYLVPAYLELGVPESASDVILSNEGGPHDDGPQGEENQSVVDDDPGGSRTRDLRIKRSSTQEIKGGSHSETSDALDGVNGGQTGGLEGSPPSSVSDPCQPEGDGGSEDEPPSTRPAVESPGARAASIAASLAATRAEILAATKEPAEYSLRLLGDPILRQPTKQVSAVEDSPNKIPAALIPRMLLAMRGRGVAIAANQVGSHLRVAIAQLERPVVTRGIQDTYVLIYPRIVKRSPTSKTWTSEGSISLPGFYTTTHRNDWVVVEYFDEAFERKGMRVSDKNAQILQHVIDQLDGKMITDGVSRQQRRQAERLVEKEREHRARARVS